MEMIKKMYIAGKITGLDRQEYLKNFNELEDAINERGFVAVNPTCLPQGLEYDDYMHICYSMIDVVDAVYFLNNWRESNGALNEFEYARRKGKQLFFGSLEEITNESSSVSKHSMSDMQQEAESGKIDDPLSKA